MPARVSADVLHTSMCQPAEWQQMFCSVLFCRNEYYWRVWEEPSVWAAVHFVCGGRDGTNARYLPCVSHVSPGNDGCNVKLKTRCAQYVFSVCCTFRPMDVCHCWLMLGAFFSWQTHCSDSMHVSRRRNLNINSHFISCPCGLYINTKVCQTLIPTEGCMRALLHLPRCLCLWAEFVQLLFLVAAKFKTSCFLQ